MLNQTSVNFMMIPSVPCSHPQRRKAVQASLTDDQKRRGDDANVSVYSENKKLEVRPALLTLQTLPPPPLLDLYHHCARNADEG